MPCCLLLQAASKLIDLEHYLWANQLVHTPHVKCIKKSQLIEIDTDITMLLNTILKKAPTNIV